MIALLRSTNAYRILARDAQTGNLSHTTLAVFPDANCLRPLLKECAKVFFGSARADALIEKERYSDCLFFPAEGEKLNAADCAAIADESALRPVESGKKLFVLLLDGATPLVQNKLLKLLEEPPEGVFFLLGASAEHVALPTVLSRAKKIATPPFSEEEIYGALCRMYPGREGARECAAASGGIFSTAQQLLLDGGEEFLLAERFLSANGETLCRELEKRKEKKSFLAALGLVLRDVLFLSSGEEKYCFRRTEGVRRLAREYAPPVALAALGFVGEAEKEIVFNANFGQALYGVLLKIGKEKEKWQTLSS